jgi:hypothetical protein
VSLPPDDLAEIVFRALYPAHELARAEGHYAVRCGDTLLVSDSVGELARFISELHNHDVELTDMIADGTEPLPQRPK